MKKNISLALIFIIITILSTIYVFYGNNWLVDQHFRQKERNNEFIRNDLMQRLVQIEAQSQKILDEISRQEFRLEIFPQQKIKLQARDSTSFAQQITNPPAFDHNKLFLVFDRELKAFAKKTRSELWSKQYQSAIKKIILLDVNRLLVFTSGQKIFCVSRRDGEIIWQKNIMLNALIFSPKIATQIRLDQDKRLDSSIILLHETDKLKLLHNISGEEIYDYQAEQKIDFVSDFDLFTQAIYLVEENVLIELALTLE